VKAAGLGEYRLTFPSDGGRLRIVAAEISWTIDGQAWPASLSSAPIARRPQKPQALVAGPER
jgi:hypothetical protein